MRFSCDDPFSCDRKWLLTLAAVSVDARLRAKVDLSGIVQQTLFEAVQVSDEAKPVSQARRAWLRTILARNLTDEIRRIRADRRNVAREISMDQELLQSSWRIRNCLAGDQTSPSAKLMAAEQMDNVMKAMSTLPDTIQTALIMRYFQQISLAEIAEHLNRTPAAVAGLLKRGLQQLRDQLLSGSPQ